jgi:hypothetical protein
VLLLLALPNSEPPAGCCWVLLPRLPNNDMVVCFGKAHLECKGEGSLELSSKRTTTRLLFAGSSIGVGVAACHTNRLLPRALTVDFQLHTGAPIQRPEPASRQLHNTHHVGPSAKVRIQFLAGVPVLTCAQIQPAHADRHHTSTRQHPQGPRSRCQFCSSALGLILHWRKMQDIQ